MEGDPEPDTGATRILSQKAIDSFRKSKGKFASLHLEKKTSHHSCLYAMICLKQKFESNYLIGHIHTHICEENK